MGSWILILVNYHTPLLSFFVVMLKSFGQLIEADSGFLFVTCPSFLDYFLTFWHMLFQAHLYFPAPSLEFLHGALIPFHGEWHSEAKIRTLGMLTATMTSYVIASRP